MWKTQFIPRFASTKMLNTDVTDFFHVRTVHLYINKILFSVDKKKQLDVTFCILYFSSNSCSTCFGQPCAHHEKLTTASFYSLVLVCTVAAGRLSRPVGR